MTREGIDDRRYLHLLETTLADAKEKTRPGRRLAAAIQLAESLLQEMRAAIYPDIRAYLHPSTYGRWTMDPADTGLKPWVDWTDGRVCDRYRRRIAGAVVALLSAE